MGTRYVLVGAEFAASWLTAERPEALTTAPPDLRVIGADWIPVRRMVRFLCESEEWENAPEGSEPEVFEPIYLDPFAPTSRRDLRKYWG